MTSQGGAFYGTAVSNGGATHDMVLLSGATYGSEIYVGPMAGAHVASAADPVVGYTNYCHSGIVTGVQCGHTAVSVNATLCTASGCKAPVVAFTGGVLPQAGDSGAPFYVSSLDGAPDKHLRGHVIAGSGSTYYAEKWSRVAAKYGVTIGS